MMNRNLVTLIVMALCTFGVSSVNAAGSVELDKAPIDISDKASLKRGAKAFADNCFS